ncbi:PAS domain-containing protein, partial [Pelomicrobium sp. G1]|uniref:PAS domain-containing protein n=1 Tax=Pelomicrobium sp. G1 TaxID=3452920 RepID=UPI003F7669B1
VLASGGPRQFVEAVPTPDGTPHDWLVVKFPFRDAQGAGYVGGMAVDVTERVQAERALRESERRFHALARISPVGIFCADLAGNYMYV